MSPSDAQGRELLTPETERVLARQAAVAALTAVGRMRTDAEAGSGSAAGSGAGGAGSPGAGAGSGEAGAGLGATSDRGTGSRVGRPVGFASPERAVRRRTRGGWAARG